MSLAFVMEIHQWPMFSPHKKTVTRKMFPFDDIIMVCSDHYNSSQSLVHSIVACICTGRQLVIFTHTKHTHIWGAKLCCVCKPVAAAPHDDIMTWKSFLHHDDVIKWKHFPCYWPFVQEIYRSPVNSLHKGQWCKALMFSFISAQANGRVNNGEAGDFRCHSAEAPFVDFCESKIFYRAKVLVRFFESHSYLTGVTINVMFNS